MGCSGPPWQGRDIWVCLFLKGPSTLVVVFLLFPLKTTSKTGYPRTKTRESNPLKMSHRSKTSYVPQGHAGLASISISRSQHTCESRGERLVTVRNDQGSKQNPSRVDQSVGYYLDASWRAHCLNVLYQRRYKDQSLFQHAKTE